MVNFLKMIFIVLICLTTVSCGSKKKIDDSSYTEDGVKNPLQTEFTTVAGDRVFFSFDSSKITSEGQETLVKQAAWLKEHPNMSVTVAGHCDTRGTAEYNLALGEKRGHAIRMALVKLGIEESRITVISYGKERPDVEGDTEEVHAKNRRGVTLLN